MAQYGLKGKIALVTGASSGIGEAAAQALAQEGVRVIMAARSKEKLESLQEELGDGARAIPTDVGDWSQVRKLFQIVKADFGGLDLLFNNAGVGYHNRFAESTPEEWHATIKANLYGVLYCTKEAIPLMRGRPGAMICSVSSVGGRHGLEGWSVYNATKFAVVGFHDALRKELGPENIRVSIIEPGAVYTNWGYNVSKEEMKAHRDKWRALEAKDIADALVFAFSRPSHFNILEMLLMPTLQTYP